MIYVSVYLALGMIMWLCCMYQDYKYGGGESWPVRLCAGAMLLVGWPVVAAIVGYQIWKEESSGRK